MTFPQTEQTHTLLEWLESQVYGIQKLIRENRQIDANEHLGIMLNVVHELQKRNVK